jgi:hypothetical protein
MLFARRDCNSGRLRGSDAGDYRGRGGSSSYGPLWLLSRWGCWRGRLRLSCLRLWGRPRGYGGLASLLGTILCLRQNDTGAVRK